MLRYSDAAVLVVLCSRGPELDISRATHNKAHGGRARRAPLVKQRYLNTWYSVLGSISTLLKPCFPILDHVGSNDRGGFNSSRSFPVDGRRIPGFLLVENAIMRYSKQ